MKYRCKKDLPIEIYDEHDMPTLEYRRYQIWDCLDKK